MFDIVEAKYIEDYKIEFLFEDNSKGIVDFTEYKKKPGLFSSFNDVDFFKNFKFDEELCTITWKNGLDIAPETIYIKVTGNTPKGLE